VSAVVFHTNKWLTLAALFFSFFIYLSMYSKLAFFRWIPKNKNEK